MEQFNNKKCHKFILCFWYKKSGLMDFGLGY